MRFVLAALAVLIVTTTLASGQDRAVNVVDVEGVIDPVVARFIQAEIDAAEEMGAEAVIIRMDTPGGLDLSMRTIIKKILNSPVPIITYVSPSGARAASAGVFITLSSHLSAMAPGTNIGAAHPVSLGGDSSEEIEKKAVNDAAAYIRSIAKRRGRDVNWAEDAVRKSISATEEEALRKGIIDHIAPDLASLLAVVDGSQVETPDGTKTLRTRGATVRTATMTFAQRILHTLADPNLAYILLILGIYGLIYELANPGFGFGGIGGAISLVIALYSLQILPVNLAGLALVILAFILFIAEAFVVSHGVLGGGGIISLLIGSLVLIDTRAAELRVSLFLILPVVIASVLFSLLIVGAGIRAQRRRVTTGAEGMVGKSGEARTKISRKGQVFVDGELWNASSQQGAIQKGTPVRVVKIDGLKLIVEKI